MAYVTLSSVRRSRSSTVQFSTYCRIMLEPMNVAASIVTPVLSAISRIGSMSGIVVRAAQLGRMLR
jgi:hypothetical protein